jgi:GAF domain-containing protein
MCKIKIHLMTGHPPAVAFINWCAAARFYSFRFFTNSVNWIHETVTVSDMLCHIKSGDTRVTSELDRDLSQMKFSSEELECLFLITRVAASSSSLDEIFEKALPPLLKVSRADAAELWLFNPDTSLLELNVQHGEPRADFFQVKQLDLGADIPGIAAQTLEPVVSLNLGEDSRFHRSQMVEAGYNAFCAFPMTFYGRLIGVLCLAYRQSQLCDRRACGLLSTVSVQLAFAVRNSQLLEMEQKCSIKQKQVVQELRTHRT